MSQCPFYNTKSETLRSYTIAHPDPPKTIRTPWCAHPRHSPVAKDEALKEGKELKCGGDWKNKCPIPRDQLGDI